ncbi:MAG: hypothetical protein KAH86_02900, partial [Methanosarcinales archaeon]|nr:hypothetical protein [Methanosarcinales archaeon]
MVYKCFIAHYSSGNKKFKVHHSMLTDALITSAQYLAYIVPVMVAGIVIAELLVELGLVQKIGFIVLPLT